MKKIFVLFLTIFFVFYAFASNTQIKSYEEQYFDFLVLSGKAERPYIQYRSLNSNRYSNENGLWNNKNVVSTPILKGLTTYGPRIFVSYNTSNPYGQNDGSLWQGVGFNAQIKAGASYELSNFQFTFFPEFDFSQNKEYTTFQSTKEYITSNNKYEYFWGTLDLPQRFGNDKIITLSPGESEVRFSKGSFTLATSTQSRWIGNGTDNSILLSNNAANFPYLELGLRNQPLGSLGTLETYYSLGILKNSDYARVQEAKGKKSLLSTFSLAFQPSLIKGFSLGFNVAGHSDFSNDGWLKFYQSIFNPDAYEKIGNPIYSITTDWLYPSIGFEAYTEAAWNHNLKDLFTADYRTFGIQIGIKKTFEILPQKNIYGMLTLEGSFLEMANESFVRNSEPFTFYGSVTSSNYASYTNKGQLLGAATGYGGNSQYVGFTLFYPQGATTAFVRRANPDNDYLYYVTTKDAQNKKWNTSTDYYFGRNLCFWDFGINSVFYTKRDLSISGGLVFERTLSKNYIQLPKETNFNYNIHFELGLTYNY